MSVSGRLVALGEREGRPAELAYAGALRQHSQFSGAFAQFLGGVTRRAQALLEEVDQPKILGEQLGPRMHGAH